MGAGWKTLPALMGLAASSLLNAMYYIPAILVIWGKTGETLQPAAKQDTYRSWELYISIGCFLIFNVILGTAFEPIFNVIYQGLALL